MTFVINLNHVRFDDLKADDVGSCRPTGTKHTYNNAGETVYMQGASRAAEAYPPILCPWNMSYIAQDNCLEGMCQYCMHHLWPFAMWVLHVHMYC